MKRCAWLLAALGLLGCRAPLSSPGTLQAPRPHEAGDLGEGAPAPPWQATGLMATYEDGSQRVVTWVATPHFALEENESLHPSIKPAFEATWSGVLQIEEAAAYTFWSAPASLQIDGQEVGAHPVSLPPGAHTLTLRIKRSAGPARFALQWASESFARESVPARVLRPTSLPSEAKRWQVIDQGRALYDELGCRGCHHKAGDDPHVDNFYHLTRRGRGPGLSRLGRRLNAAWVYAWLGNPSSHRGNAKMPVILHSERERADVTAFLMSLQEQGATTGVEQGDWDDTPLDEEDTAKAESLFGSIGCAACHGDAASKTSLAAVGSKFQPAALPEYLARPENFDHSGRMPGMVRGEESRLLARWLLRNHKRSLESPPPPGDAGRGRTLVQTRGCLGCHSLDLAGLQVFSDLKAPAFETLPAAPVGCLADTPQQAYARYNLTTAQRQSLVAYMTAKDVAESPAWELARTLDSRGCRQCHETDRPAQNQFPEMPPSLQDVGNKLRPEWIARTVDSGRGIRPWMKLRMPRYHRAGVVGKLLAATAGAPTRSPELAAPPDVHSRQVQEGVQYLGRAEGGMSCVTCHRFGAFDPQSATPAPDLMTVAQRLRPEWFVRWLRDPGRLSPGTQMPAFFAGVDEDFANQRIAALWTALSLGSKVPAPEGVDLSGARLPYPMNGKPVVVRTFLEGAGPRALAVGFPGAAYAFDAETCQLLFTWWGDFLDMKPVWVGRGGDMAVPLASVDYRSGAEALLQLADDADAKPRFKGYALERGVPVFEYEMGPLVVRDKTIPDPKTHSFVRTLDVRGGPAKVRLTLQPRLALESSSPRASGGVFALKAGGRMALKLRIENNKAAEDVASRRP